MLFKSLSFLFTFLVATSGAAIADVKLDSPQPPQKPEITSLSSSSNPASSPETKKQIFSSTEDAAELLPHRATYSISLDNHTPALYKNDETDEDIADAKGEMTLQVAKVGEGWAVEQKSTLHIYYKDGSAEQIITTLATYESIDGLKYSFNARTTRGDQEELISGQAILASKGGAGLVNYQHPDASTVQLPAGTIFPTQHLRHMLKEASKGKMVASNIVFDGSSEAHEPVQVDTIFGPTQDPKLALSNKEIFQTKKMLPMRMAVYTVDSTRPEADYEIIQNVLLECGIIRDMTLDYGNFKVKAIVTEIKVFSQN